MREQKSSGSHQVPVLAPNTESEKRARSGGPTPLSQLRVFIDNTS